MTTRRQAVLYIALTTILWGVPALFIHHFAEYFDAHTQNFWRYFSALLFLVVYGRLAGERWTLGSWRAYLRAALAATVLVLYQTCFTKSLYRALPAFTVLLIQFELIVAVGLSCAFFADERRVARSGWFIVGGCAALVGAVGMVVFSREYGGATAAGDRANLLIAVALVGGAAVFWAGYSVAIKWCLQTTPPFAAFANVEAMATVMFLILAVRFGNPGQLAHVPASIATLVVLSGVGCIAVAHIFYTQAIHRLGVLVCNTVILATPIMTAVPSWILFGERLTLLQILSAVVLIGGAAGAIQARARQGKTPAVGDNLL
jgi:drug/metabolite transporter (DMT)-like permease